MKHHAGFTQPHFSSFGDLFRKRFRKKSGAGFTLLEQMVSLIVLAGMSLIVVTIFISANNFSNDEQQRIQVGETAARVLASLDDTLREGRLILTSGVVNGTTYTTSDTTLVMALPSLVNGLPTAANDTVVVRRNTTTNTLEQLTAPDATSTRAAGTIQLAIGVNDVYFRYTADDPASSTAITVLVSSTKTANKRAFTRTTILYETLRNHP